MFNFEFVCLKVLLEHIYTLHLFSFFFQSLDQLSSQATGETRPKVNMNQTKPPAMLAPNPAMPSSSTGPPAANSFPSVFLYQDYTSMMGLNQMMVQQARRAANHAPNLPMNEDQMQQALKPSPSPQPHSKRGFSFSGKRSFASAPADCTDQSKSRRMGSPGYEPQSDSGIYATEVVCGDRKRRFNRTRDALERSGLMGITMKTADLLKSNETLERDIEKLKRETEQLLQAVLKNPGNEHFKERFLSGSKQFENL